MLSASSTSKRLCQTSIHLCVGKRRTHNLYRSSTSRSPQNSLDVFLTQQTKSACNASRTSDVCNRFWTFVASESPVISKTLFRNDSIVGTILIRGVEVIGCTRSCDRSSDLHGVAERSNVPLAFSPSSSSSSFFSRLEAMSSSRDCLFIARTGVVNNLLQRFDNRLKMPVQCYVLLDSIGL